MCVLGRRKKSSSAERPGSATSKDTSPQAAAATVPRQVKTPSIVPHSSYISLRLSLSISEGCKCQQVSPSSKRKALARAPECCGAWQALADNLKKTAYSGEEEKKAVLKARKKHMGALKYYLMPHKRAKYDELYPPAKPGRR